MTFAASQTEHEIEFQGALVCCKMKDGPHGIGKRSIWQDAKIDREAYEQAFAKMAASLPPEKRFYLVKQHSSGDVERELYAAELSDRALHQVHMLAIPTVRERLHPPTRGTVSEFSRRSRGRLLRLVVRLDPKASGLFLTVTYRRNMQDRVLAKKHLDKLPRWLKNHYPDVAFLWRMEYQAHGAIHFHLLCFGVEFIEADKITKYWQKMTGDDSYPDLAKIENRRKASYYVSKYMSKDSRAPLAYWIYAQAARSCRLALSFALLSAAGFIHVTYLENENFVGRFWGVVNREKLPYAPLRVRRVVGGGGGGRTAGDAALCAASMAWHEQEAARLFAVRGLGG